MDKEKRREYYRMYTRNKRKDPEYRKKEYERQCQWYARIKAQVLVMREERAQQQ